MNTNNNNNNIGLGSLIAFARHAGGYELKEVVAGIGAKVYTTSKGLLVVPQGETLWIPVTGETPKKDADGFPIVLLDAEGVEMLAEDGTYLWDMEPVYGDPITKAQADKQGLDFTDASRELSKKAEVKTEAKQIVLSAKQTRQLAEGMASGFVEKVLITDDGQVKQSIPEDATYKALWVVTFNDGKAMIRAFGKGKQETYMLPLPSVEKAKEAEAKAEADKAEADKKKGK